MTEQTETAAFSLPLTPQELDEIKAAASASGGDAVTFIKTTVLEKARSLMGAKGETGGDGQKIDLVDLLVSLDLRVRNLEASIGSMNQTPRAPQMGGMGGMGMGAMGGMGGMGPMGGGMGPMGGGIGMGGWGGQSPWGGGGPGMDPFGQPGWPDPFDPFTNQDPPTT